MPEGAAATSAPEPEKKARGAPGKTAPLAGIEQAAPAPSALVGRGKGFADPRIQGNARAQLALGISHVQGNRFLARLIEGSSPGAAVIQRQPGGGAAAGQPPDASALVATQYPNLKVPAEGLAELQKLLDARFEIAKVEEKMKAYAGSYASDDVAKMEQLRQEAGPHLDVARRTIAISIPTATMLGNDILPPGGEVRGREPMFREALMKTLLSHPVQAYIGPGEKPEPLFTFKWGPNRWVLGSDSGTIKWSHLMQVQKWNVDYQRALTGDMVEILEDMEKLRKQMRGSPLDLGGKKLGETYGRIWNTTIKVRAEVGNISGYGTDPDEQRELSMDWAKAQGAKVKVRAPDGYTHIYTLDDFTVLDMKEPPGGDGYVWLLSAGGQVSGVVEVWTKDGQPLEAANGPKGAGWRTKEVANEYEQFAMGAILGDIMEDPSATMTFGQVVIGCIPIVGQIADARDVAVGIHKMWSTGGKDGKLQTAFALIGFIPLIGDGAKKAWSLARSSGKEAADAAAKKAALEAAKGGEQALARGIMKNTDEAARAFGISLEEAKAAGKSLREAGEKAVKEGGEAAVEYIKLVSKQLDDLGGDAGALVTMLGGKWAAVAKQLKSMPGGAELGSKMNTWRNAQFAALEKKVIAESATDLGPDVVKRTAPPKMEKTGTPAFDSDVDVSFMGDAATADRNAAVRAMDGQFGSGWRDLLDADIFADPTRLHMFEGPLGEIGGQVAKNAEKRIVKEAELNVLAKMLKDGVPAETVAKHAKEMGVDMATVMARNKEITALSKDYLTGLLKRGTTEAEVKKLAGEMGVSFDDVVKNLDTFEDAYRKLEIQMDALHQQFNAAKAARDLPRQAQLAEEMAAIQGKLNAAIPGPYMTPGGGAKHVTRREMKLRGSAGYKAMSPAMGYMAVLDDLYMLRHSLPAAGEAFTAKSAKSMAKYGDRLLVTAGQFGVDMGGKSARPLFDTYTTLLAGARKDAARLGNAASALGSAKQSLESQLGDMIKAAKQNADDYLADVASGGAKGGTGDVAGSVAKTELTLNQQQALVNTLKEPTKDELERQQDEAEEDKANAGIAQ